MRVRELAQWLAATFEGDGEKELTGVATLEAAGAGDLAFVGTRKAAQQAESSAAGCLARGAPGPQVRPSPLSSRLVWPFTWGGMRFPRYG